jgi:nucleotide-binding universal stress UspA family protein
VKDAPVGATLLKLARAEQADLLVMGAYSHSPITEAMLGGVTRHILAQADLPVLMVH